MKMKRLAAFTVALLLIFGLGTQCFAIYLPDGTSDNGTSAPSEPVHNHSFGDWIVTKEPTCSEFGECHRVCSCGEVEYGFVDKLPHTFGEWEVIEDPTENSAGLRVRTCQVCGETEREQIIPTGTILPGSEGPDVEWLQGALVENGYMDSQNQDGLYGRETENAVREAQKGNGLPQDGTAWPGTIKSLIHDFSGWIMVKEPTYREPGIMERTCKDCGYTERVEIGKRVNPGSYGDDVKAIQEALDRLGYPVGEKDGSYGRHTDQAVAQWQKDHGYEPDGIVWPGVWNELLPGRRPDRRVPEDDDSNPQNGSMIIFEADTNDRNFVDVMKDNKKDDGNPPDEDPPSDVSPMAMQGAELTAVLEIEILTEPKMGENGPYYDYGQNVYYRYVLHNLSDYTIRDIRTVPLSYWEWKILNLPEGNFFLNSAYKYLSFTCDELGPKQSVAWPTLQGHYISEWTKGAEGTRYICGAAYCNFYDGETYLGATQPTAEATFKFGKKEAKNISAELEVHVLNGPKNGLFYTEGETVSYKLVLTNTSKYDIKHIETYQLLGGLDEWIEQDYIRMSFDFEGTLPPGEKVFWGPFEMRIPASDADDPGSKNTVNVSYVIDGFEAIETVSLLDGGGNISAFASSDFYEGDELIGSYPSVAEEFIPIGVEKPDARLEIVETSAPANGIYYTEGETFEADFIVTNTGNIVLTVGDVYINQTETWSQLVGTAVSLEPGGSQTVFHYSEPVLPVHVERGFQDISAKAECSFKSVSGGKAVTRNAEHTFPAGYKPEAVLKVNEISSPSNTYFYEENETIAYEFVVENTGKVDMESAALSFSAGGVSYGTFANLGPLPAGASSKPVTISCAVSHEMAQDGKVTADGQADGVFLHGMELTMTDSAVSFTGIPALKTSISVVNPPEKFFKRDDTIHYSIIVTNIGNVDIPKVDVYLETPEGTRYIHTSALAVGEQLHYTESYKVTGPDVGTGSVAATAIAQGTIFTEPALEATDTVTSPAGMLPVNVRIEKTVTNKPKNGSYFKKDEVITYDITVYNDGEEAIIYADVGDNAPDGAFHLGMTPSIAGGSSYSFPFSFTVRQQDADAGQVENTAEAAVRLPDDSMMNISSTVTSPAGNDPIPAVPGPVDDFCRMVEVTKEDGTTEIDFDLCTEHLITADNAEADSSSAVEIWKTEIDAEFADLLGLLNEEQAETLKAKQEAFAAALTEAEAAAADDTARAELIEKLEDYCANLCYIEHTAKPEEIAGLVPDTF